MGIVSMTQKTRGYSGLNICTVFVLLAGILYIFGGLLNVLAALAARSSELSFAHIGGAVLAFSLALICFAFAALIRLAIHVADDLYMLRLIAVNAYSRLPQLPKP